jgi:DNA-directed RNA polymerase specialized sigma24 family protein
MEGEANEGAILLSELASFAKTYEEHGPKPLAMLRRRIDPALASRLDAEDVLHETFLLARRRWGRPARERMSPYAMRGSTGWPWTA